MLSDSEFLNRVAAARLNAPFKNAINSRFIFDATAVKPIYNQTDGFVSHAKTNPDALIFGRPPNKKYDIAPAKHGAKPEISLFGTASHRPGAPPRTTMRPERDFLSKFYGLPQARDIDLFSPEVAAMGIGHSKTPEADVMVHNWQTREARTDLFGTKLTDPGAFDEFMADPRIQEFVKGTPAKNTAGVVRVMRDRARARAAPPAAPPVAVNLAFPPSAAATPTPSAAALSTALPDDDETPTPGAPPAATATAVQDEGKVGDDPEATVDVGDEQTDEALKKESTKFYVKFSSYNKRQLYDAYLNIVDKLKLNPRDNAYISKQAAEIRGLLDAAKGNNTESKRTKAVAPNKLRTALTRLNTLLSKPTTKKEPVGPLPKVG